MFDVLMHSRARWRLSPGNSVLVAAFHGMVVLGAVQVGEPAPPVQGPKPETTFFVVPRPKVAAAPLTASAPAPAGAPAFELPAPLVIPEGIPPVLPGPSLDPSVLRALTAERPGSGVPGAGPPAASDPVPGAHEVDEPAAVVSQPAPRYPPALRLAQVEGRVLLEFIIDTTGRVERGSLRVIESSQPGFEASARETLERSLFRPGRVAGRPVRQRTLQSVAFRIRPD